MQYGISQLNPFTHYDQVKAVWQTIESNAISSYYLSWEWMANWLDCLPKSENVVFVYASDNGKPIFCYFLGYQKRLQNKIIYCNRGYLNRTGDHQKDKITLEHNGILINKNYIEKFSDVFEKSGNWDELIAKFVSPEQAKYLTNSSKYTHWLEEEDKAFYVDLDQVRQADNDLITLLSKNKRSQIRRSIKAYEKEGEVRIHVAKTLEEANLTLSKLKELHQTSWQKKGRSGSFSSEFFNQFHQQLIKKNYPHGNIELVTVYAGDTIIGCLYNFIYQNRVYFYQSGLAYRSENVYKPGFVSHLLAINHYSSLGYDAYDFLVGEMDYKKSLSTHSYNMFSYRLRKNRTRFVIEDKLRKLKQKLS